MKILIAGAGGFIGNYLCHYLKNRGHDIIAVYRNTKPRDTNLKCYQIDLKNEIRIEEEIDIIINLSSQMRGKRIVDHLDNTVLPMRNLLAFAEYKHVKTFIGISSIAIYGEVTGAVSETSDRMNADDYGTSKYVIERLLEDAAIENKYILRLPRMLGPEADLSYPWIPLLTSQLADDRDIFYYNPQLLYNNLMHVESLAEFILTLIHQKVDGYETIVLGTKNAMPIIEIIDVLKREIGSHSRLIEKPFYGRNTCYRIDISKAVSMGYMPMETTDVLKRFVQENINFLRSSRRKY